MWVGVPSEELDWYCEQCRMFIKNIQTNKPKNKGELVFH